MKIDIMSKERDEEKRQEFLATIKFEDFSKIIYIDELGLKNSMTEEYGWSLRGVPICGEKKGRVTEKINIIAGMTEGEIIAPLIYNYNADALFFNIWLERHLIPELALSIPLLEWIMPVFIKQRKQKKLLKNMAIGCFFCRPILQI